MFSVPGKYPDGQFLKLGIFTRFFLDLINNDSMLGFQDILITLSRAFFPFSGNGCLDRRSSGSASSFPGS